MALDSSGETRSGTALLCLKWLPLLPISLEQGTTGMPPEKTAMEPRSDLAAVREGCCDQCGPRVVMQKQQVALGSPWWPVAPCSPLTQPLCSLLFSRSIS